MPDVTRHVHQWSRETRIVQRCACGAYREWDGFEWWLHESESPFPPGQENA